MHLYSKVFNLCQVFFDKYLKGVGMTISENQYNGAPIYFKDNQWASKYFGGVKTLNEPKRKFAYIAGFVPNSNILSMGDTREIHENLSFLVKSFTPPAITMDVVKIDQYNKRRVIQTRLNYGEARMVFHDDMGNKIFKVMYEYLKYYYSEISNTKDDEWNLDTVSEFINEGRWGYTLNFRKHFFKNIYVAWINGGILTYVSLINPLISSIGLSALDYSDDGTPAEIDMAFEFEGMIFKEINVDLQNLQSQNELEGLIWQKLALMDEVGQPGEGPPSHDAVTGKERIPSLGEIFTDAQIFYEKYNGKPTLRNAIDDYVVRPILGSTALSSWGNFNFGGIGVSKASDGLLGGIGAVVGKPYDYIKQGKVTGDVFKAMGKIPGVTNNLTQNAPKASVAQSNNLYSRMTGIVKKVR